MECVVKFEVISEYYRLYIFPAFSQSHTQNSKRSRALLVHTPVTIEIAFTADSAVIIDHGLHFANFRMHVANRRPDLFSRIDPPILSIAMRLLYQEYLIKELRNLLRNYFRIKLASLRISQCDFLSRV